MSDLQLETAAVPPGVTELVRSYSRVTTLRDGTKMPESLCDISDFVKTNPEYAIQLSKLPRYRQALGEGALESAEFCVALGRVSLWRDYNAGPIKCHIFIPENPFVAYNDSQRTDMQKALIDGVREFHPSMEDIKNFINNGERLTIGSFLGRVTAGGAVTILKVPDENAKLIDPEKKLFTEYREYIVVGQKTPDAGVDADRLIPQSGIAEFHDGVGDWHDPLRLVVGECVEEVRIIDGDDPEWYYLPNFKNGSLNSRVQLTLNTRIKALKHFIENISKKSHGYYFQFRNQPVEWFKRDDVDAEILQLGEDELHVTCLESTPNDMPPLRKGLLALDWKIGVVDFMSGVRITCRKPLSRLVVCDGEINEGTLLWRNTLLFDADQLVELVRGNQSEAIFFGCTLDYRYEGNREWRANVRAVVSERPKLAIPLRASLKKLLEQHLSKNKGIPFFEEKEEQKVMIELEGCRVVETGDIDD